MTFCTLDIDYRYIKSIDWSFELSQEHSFLAGKWLDFKTNNPLIFDVDCPRNEYPGHYFDEVIPLFSKAMIEQFRLAGIDNFQLFPAVLVNRSEKVKWDDYFALNVLGIIDSVDMEASISSTLMPGDMDDGIPPLVDFSKMVIDPSKVKGALMFRELRSPEVIVFDYKVVDYLKKNKPPEGWRIKVKKLESKN